MRWSSRSLSSSTSLWKLFGEMKTLSIIFVLIFGWILVVTNFNLFAANFMALFDGKIQTISPLSTSLISDDNTISSVMNEADQQNQEIQWLLAMYQKNADATTVTPSLEETLQSRLMDYDFSFNTTPPVNRILVPSLGLDVPIVANENMDAKDFAAADFDEQLNEWVVKYPTTPAPGQEGNTLLFGHTSYVVRKSNPYGTIFKDLPKLKDNTLIQILREGNLYEYKVVDLFIVNPKQVNDQYMTYQNAGGSYITLMWCYPLWTDKKRIMVVAKLID